MTPAIIAFLAQLLVEAPQLITTVEGIARTHLGATEADLAAARDQARVLAAKLGKPGDYFDLPKTPTPEVKP